MLFCLLCWLWFWSEYALLVGRAGGARVCCGWVSEAGVALVSCLGLGVCWRCGRGGVSGPPLRGGHASSLWTSGGRCGGCREARVCWGLWCVGGRLSGVGLVTAVLVLSCRGFCQCAWSVSFCPTLRSPNRVGFTRRGVGSACACVPLGVGGAVGVGALAVQGRAQAICQGGLQAAYQGRAQATCQGGVQAAYQGRAQAVCMGCDVCTPPEKLMRGR